MHGWFLILIHSAETCNHPQPIPTYLTMQMNTLVKHIFFVGGYLFLGLPRLESRFSTYLKWYQIGLELVGEGSCEGRERIVLPNLKCVEVEISVGKIGHHTSIHFTQPRSKVHHPKANEGCDTQCNFWFRVWLKTQSLHGIMWGFWHFESMWTSAKPGSKTPFSATIVGRRRRGQKSPPAGRRRRAEKATPRCGAKRPMGCTSSAVGPAARSSVLRRWRVPQPKDGRSCAEATRTPCISLTARPPRGQRSMCRKLKTLIRKLKPWFGN